MNLYTICDKSESLIDLKSIYGVKFQNYSMEDYIKFIEIAKKHYIHRLFYWYETDMSDSDSGSVSDDYPINYTNFVIKDNNLYGVLVKTRGSYPEYFILEFEKKHFKVALGGGYNDRDYDWWIKDKDLKNLDTLNISSSYVLLCEKIYYDNDKIFSYERDIIGFFQENCIIENNSIIGLKYKINGKSHEFIFTNEDSLFERLTDENGVYKTVINIKLVKLDEEFLNMNIYGVSYDDFKKGNFKLLDL